MTSVQVTCSAWTLKSVLEFTLSSIYWPVQLLHFSKFGSEIQTNPSALRSLTPEAVGGNGRG